MGTVRLTIDGRQIAVEQGGTVLEAALAHGVEIPYYCYHPALGVDGSCRVCIVHIEKIPKLQTACSTICTDGMDVRTRTPEVIAARAGVFEFLLINHPLDCPVCDKGGECPLQDFAYTFGPNLSRMEFPRRVFDGQGVRADVDFGPTLMLNRNRCILCTRCIRFMRDVDTDPQIGIVDRGYRSEIATFEERGVHSLLSGNLMDVCPVGAILTKDYRFKSRPWDNPQVVDTICTFCAKGCNTSVWLKAKPEWAKAPRLARITPRLNSEVNGYWMCDIGRFDYHWIEGEDRLRQPLMRDRAGMLRPSTWHEALESIRTRLDASAPRFLVSAHASLEELYLARELARLLRSPDPAMTVSWRYREKPQPQGTKFKVPAVDAPNVRGASDLGLIPAMERPDLSALRAAVEAGAVDALYVLDPGPPGSIGDLGWLIEARRAGRPGFLVVQGVLLSELVRSADLVLPGLTFAEKDGVYTSEQGRPQAGARALPPLVDAREDWRILLDISTVLGARLEYSDLGDVRTAVSGLRGGVAAYKDLASLTFGRPVPARSWLQTSNPSERWKWDFLFVDRPPLKFESDAERPPVVVPLRKIE